MNTLFIQHSSPHHAYNSGYSRIVDYYQNSKTISGEPVIPYRIAKLFAAMHSQKAGLYNSDSVHKEFELYKTIRVQNENPTVVHYLNAERDVRHVVNNKMKFKNVHFCGTFHKPPHVLDWRVSNPKYVKHLQGAIAVGTNQVDYLKEHFKIPHVAYIPHGIDTHFFSPDAQLKKTNTLLFVGQHLRDFEALNYSIPRIADQFKNLQVHVVVHPAYKKKITAHKSVSIFSNLSDLELKQHYQEASLLFLPMLDSTACNSILESMACGLPIITTDVGGNAAYLEHTKSQLVAKGDYDHLIEATLRLLNDVSQIEELSVLARKKALLYDWSLISEQLKAFHNSLLH